MKPLFLVLALGCSGNKGSEPKADVDVEVDVEEEDCTPILWYADTDGDGYGDPFSEEWSCDPPDSFVGNHDDCDDFDARANPDAVWFRDVDGDGFGDPEQSVNTCMMPPGYIVESGDCDDLDGTRYPGALWYVDADDDGYGDEDQTIDACADVSGATFQAGDCDESNWLIHPDANEICDEVDNDCDGSVDSADDDVDIFTQVLMFEDADGDGYGTEVALGFGCPTDPLGAVELGDCDDTNAATHPDRLDFFDDIDSDCDGEDGLHLVTRGTVGWVSDIASTAFGVNGTSKDLDGDGKNEILAGAYNAGDNDEGGVRLFPGHLTGDLASFPEEARSWNATVPDAKAGFSVTFAGDWDGDGIEDIIAGAPYDLDDAGIVYLFSSEMESTDLSTAHTVRGTGEAESYFGHSVLALGDINGDSLDDLLIAERLDSTVNNNGGSIGILYGGDTERENLSPDDTIYSESNGDQLGYSMADVGDTDGDGVTNFLIGAPYCEAEGMPGGSGCSFLFSKTDFGVGLATLDSIPVFWGDQASAVSGFTVGSAGDFDGDGLDDMLIGAQNYDVVEDDEGAAYLILGRSDGWGSGALTESHLIMYGADIDDKAGRYFNTLGDIDADGKSDIGIVAHNSSLYVERAGTVYGLMGGHESGTILLQEEADFIVVGGGTNDYLGRAIFTAGDVNEDGLDDFFLGASGAGSYGAMYLLHGVAAP